MSGRGRAAAHLGTVCAVRVLPARNTPGDPFSARWFPSPEAFAEHLRDALAAPLASWSGFSRRWPVVLAEEGVVAPGLPGPVPTGGLEGPDGFYHLLEGAVVREAAGCHGAVLRRGPGSTEDEIDLVWFDDLTRWVLRAGVLEGEDRVCRLRLAATRERLERLLVRGRRVDAGVLDGLPGGVAVASTLEVRRAAVLVGEGWQDPGAMLAARAGVERVASRGPRYDLRRDDGGAELYERVAAPTGWRVERRAGGTPVAALSAWLEAENVALRVDLDPDLDPLAPGVRGRLAFDLASDLVVLGGGPVTRAR